MKEYKVEVFSNEKYRLGESPFYDSRTKTISWVDIMAGKFYRLKEGVRSEFDCGQAIGTALPAEEPGTYLIAGTDGLYFFADEKMTLLKTLTGLYKSYQQSNDAKSDAAGRLWFGSSLLDGAEHEPCGKLYCIDFANGGDIKIKQADTKISNGMTDGMCIDSDDNLWIAFWGGSRIEKRSGKDGSLLATVKVDAKNVTSCCFIGEKLDTLFITTSGNAQTGSHDGCLFSCRVDAKGVKEDYCL